MGDKPLRMSGTIGMDKSIVVPATTSDSAGTVAPDAAMARTPRLYGIGAPSSDPGHGLHNALVDMANKMHPHSEKF